jgi:ParB family chromosome partitioning protein
VAVLQSASPNESSKALREAAEFYKVDVGAITIKVKQEFSTKDKAKAAKTAAPKPTAKGTKKRAAA